MKKILLFLLLAGTTLLFGQNSALESSFTGWGIGGGVSLVVPENGWGRYFANQQVAPGIALTSAVRFSLGKAGELHYTPSINWWGRWDSWGDPSNNTNVDLNDWELSLNLLDVRYLPPLPKSVPVRPYVTIGLLGFTIYHYSEEVGNAYNWAGYDSYWDRYGWVDGAWYGYSNSDTDFAPTMNFSLGAEFTMHDTFWPYFDLRFSGGNVDEFIMTLGFTAQGRK